MDVEIIIPISRLAAALVLLRTETAWDAVQSQSTVAGARDGGIGARDELWSSNTFTKGRWYAGNQTRVSLLDAINLVRGPLL